jgi:hypothetical protein
MNEKNQTLSVTEQGPLQQAQPGLGSTGPGGSAGGRLRIQRGRPVRRPGVCIPIRR